MWRFCICSTKVCSFACAMLDVCANDCNSGARGIAVPKRWVSLLDILALRTSRFHFCWRAQVVWGSKGALIPTLAQPAWHMFPHHTIRLCHSLL